MKTLDIAGGTGHSRILIGEGIGQVKKYLPTEDLVVLTDHNVMALHERAFPPARIIPMVAGEKAKTLDTVKEIYGRLLELDVDRYWFILGIGGGVVCDVAGFVASTYLRGLRFGFVPTTLLAQVDASVGGKNGVNFAGYKNMVGVINQPEFVLCDPDMLKTLPQRELLSGLAEVVKHALIGNSDLFSYLEDNRAKALSLERPVIERLLYDSLVIKASIVNMDEKEKGDRRRLNFGHTFGHAIEMATGLSHGEAVSMGMTVASRISWERGYLSSQDLGRVSVLLNNMGLPTRLDLEDKGVLQTIRKDKKAAGGKIAFVLLRGIGNTVIEDIAIEDLKRAGEELFQMLTGGEENK